MRMERPLPGNLDTRNQVRVRECCVLPAPAEEYSMSAHSDMTKLVRALEREGFIVTRTRKGHFRFQHPTVGGCVIGPGTPSDHRGVKNLLAHLKRKLRAANDN
jgi:predicted RNA binding protein YcfA (HicA-like mRNA interferase family)